MASFEMVGIVREIFSPEQKSANFTVQEFILDDMDEKYPQLIKFQCYGKALEYLQHNIVGMKVNVHFNIKGRKWTSPDGTVIYFNTVQMWKMETIQGKQEPPPPPASLLPPPRS